MPTARQFEEAAIEYCLDCSAQGVWAVRVELVTPLECAVTVRLGSHHRADPGGVATLHVTYAPDQRHFICRPMEPTATPEIWLDTFAVDTYA